MNVCKSFVIDLSNMFLFAFYLLLVRFVMCLCIIVLISNIVCCVLSVCLYERVIYYNLYCVVCKGNLYIVLEIVIHERL